jgi:TfoX C-terminal domain
MSELTKLPNIGQELAMRLELAGIKSSEEFSQLGTEKVFFKLKTVFPDACHNQLYALEGAMQGKRWHRICNKRKAELQEFMKMIQKEL